MFSYKIPFTGFYSENTTANINYCDIYTPPPLEKVRPHKVKCWTKNVSFFINIISFVMSYVLACHNQLTIAPDFNLILKC